MSPGPRVAGRSPGKWAFQPLSAGSQPPRTGVDCRRTSRECPPPHGAIVRGMPVTRFDPADDGYRHVPERRPAHGPKSLPEISDLIGWDVEETKRIESSGAFWATVKSHSIGRGPLSEPRAFSVRWTTRANRRRRSAPPRGVGRRLGRHARRQGQGRAARIAANPAAGKRLGGKFVGCRSIRPEGSENRVVYRQVQMGGRAVGGSLRLTVGGPTGRTARPRSVSSRRGPSGPVTAEGRRPFCLDLRGLTPDGGVKLRACR
jgi:hypothetical protein